MRRKISDVIRSQEVFALSATASVREAAELMQAKNVGSIVVTAGGRLEGIFTERDLVCRVVARGRDPQATALADVMTKDPDTIAPSAPAMDGLRRMNDGGYRHLPVVTNGQVVGMISRRDFFGDEKARLEEEDKIWNRL
ncbi:MAG: CBS domain-containing protein [Alphaproteobacteria bacterium]|nr:CBS domain-containing protein [Alphaproteobacteria bacterium]